MKTMAYGDAIDAAVAAAMTDDDRVVVMGEDIHLIRADLFARFGPDRILSTPISESAFVGAGIGAAMAGLRPIIELMMVDFSGVTFDAFLNHMAKLEGFSGGRWTCPLVVRTPCGAGYGDGGQHGQTLWGLLGAIPGLTVVVPSTPADAYGLMRSALAFDGPVIFFEHKLLSAVWLDALGRGGRDTVRFDVPAQGAEGEVDLERAVPIGEAAVVRGGLDLTIVSLGVGVHRALEAADKLSDEGIECEVVDLRTVRPLDRGTIQAAVASTGRLLVVDEDYEQFGLSGEVAAVALEAGLSFRFGRVAVTDTLPYARHLEDAALPNVQRIMAAAHDLVGESRRAEPRSEPAAASPGAASAAPATSG